MMQFFKALLSAAIAASLLLPATAIAKPAGAKRHMKLTVYPKYSSKQHRSRYGFLPGYRQPPPLTEWRDRDARFGGRYVPYERRYFNEYGQVNYGWGRPGFYRGQWNGGSFGPCWTSTPIGMMWNCGR